MEITSSMIYYMLAQKLPISMEYRRSTNVSITTVKMYRDAPIEAGILYLLDGSAGCPNVRSCTDCAFLLFNMQQYEAPEINVKSDYGIVTKQINGVELLEAVADLFQKLQIWDCQLKDAQNESMPLLEFMSFGQRTLLHPYNIVDHNFSIVYKSPGYDEYFNSPMTENIQGHLTSISLDRANELIVDEEFHRTKNWDSLFIYPSYPSKEKFLCINIFSGNTFLARMSMPIHKGWSKLDPGEAQLYLHFARYVRKMYMNYTEDNLVRHPNDRMHNLFRALISDTVHKNVEEIEEIVHLYGWEIDHEFSLIKLQFFGGSKWNTAAQFICQQLEREWFNSCAIVEEDGILWVVNSSLSARNKFDKSFFQSLALIVREYICKAGVSDTFHDINQIRDYHLQAKAALEIGQKKDTFLWYYRFGDYVLEIMIGKQCRDFTSEQLCHKGLTKLLEYDRLHETEYSKTLYFYISNEFNITRAADKLFVHRTTFIRRLDRIKEISGIDLKSSDEILHLLISFKMLGLDQWN